MIYEFPDGRLAVVNFPPGISKLLLVEDSAIPADRTFRDAWVHTGTGVAVDMAKAREVVRKRIGANPAIDAAQSLEALKAML
jgi:hypothetical protein